MVADLRPFPRAVSPTRAGGIVPSKFLTEPQFVMVAVTTARVTDLGRLADLRELGVGGQHHHY